MTLKHESVSYQCEVCRRCFNKLDEAEACEKLHITKDSVVVEQLLYDQTLVENPYDIPRTMYPREIILKHTATDRRLFYTYNGIQLSPKEQQAMMQKDIEDSEKGIVRKRKE